jgi:pimeloyl-ACP methyl ester carboxylesterase
MVERVTAGSTWNAASWFHFQRRLAERGIPSLSYDRQGYGRHAKVQEIDTVYIGLSTPRTRPKDNSHEELYELVQHLGVSSPFVLCGVGLGANYAFAFARKYADTVTGVVLIDPCNKKASFYSNYINSAPVSRGNKNKTERAMEAQTIVTSVELDHLVGAATAVA